MDNNNFFNTPEDGIICPFCGIANPVGSTECFVCTTPLPAQQSAPAAPAAPAQVANSAPAEDIDDLFGSLDSIFDTIQSKLDETTGNVAEPAAEPVATFIPDIPAEPVAPFIPEESFTSEIPEIISEDISNDFPVFDEQLPDINDIPAAPVAPAPVVEKKATPPAAPFAAVPVKEESVSDEPKSALAKDLPAWSIEPPQVVVRRKKA